MKKEYVEEKIYYCDKKILEELISLFPDDALDIYYNTSKYDRTYFEKLLELVKKVIPSFSEQKQTLLIDVNETEDEAREYFGKEFINDFDKLLLDLTKQNIWIKMHGTLEESRCNSILSKGFMCQSNMIDSTSIDISPISVLKGESYDKYEELLNWRHKYYKYLVILGIPLESMKNGFWKKQTNKDFLDTDYPMNYMLDSEYVIGYIDVNNKKIIRNPNFKLTHDYTGCIRDQLFHRMDSKYSSLSDFFNHYTQQLNNQVKKKNDSIKFENEINDIKDLEMEKVEIITNILALFNNIKNKDGALNAKSYKNMLEKSKSIIDRLNGLLRKWQVPLIFDEKSLL